MTLGMDFSVWNNRKNSGKTVERKTGKNWEKLGILGFFGKKSKIQSKIQILAKETFLTVLPGGWNDLSGFPSFSAFWKNPLNPRGVPWYGPWGSGRLTHQENPTGFTHWLHNEDPDVVPDSTQIYRIKKPLEFCNVLSRRCYVQESIFPWTPFKYQKKILPVCKAMNGYDDHDMGVSENRDTLKSSILIGCSIINHPFWGTPSFGNTHMIINFFTLQVIKYSKSLSQRWKSPLDALQVFRLQFCEQVIVAALR